MNNSIIPINKEQFGIRHASNKISFINKILFNLIDKETKLCFEKGEQHFDNEEFGESIIWYSKAIGHKSNFAMAYCKRAYAYLFTGVYSAAINDFNKAIELKPEYNDAYFGRGYLKEFGLKDFEGAIIDYTKAIELEPKDAHAYMFRGKIYYNTGNLKGAIEDYAKASKFGCGVELKPLYEIAMSKFELLTEEFHIEYCAIEYLSNEIIKQKNIAELYFKRGKVKNKLKDYNNAITDFCLAIEQKKNDAEIYFNRGLSKDNLEDTVGAINDYSKAIELKNDYSIAYNNRAYSKSALKDFESAIEDLKKYIQFNGEEKAIYYDIGLFYYNIATNEYNSKNNDEAIFNYKQSVIYFTKAIEIDNCYAKAFGNRGQTKRMLAYITNGETKGNLNDNDGVCADFNKAHELGDNRALGWLNQWCD